MVDLDPVKANDPKGTPDGVTSLQALCERAGQAVPATYRTRTASGGHHLYLTAPDGVRLGNSAGRLGKHIDTRAHGGYVIAAGSTLPNGTYDVVDPTAPAPLPEWLHRPLTLRQVTRGLDGRTRAYPGLQVRDSGSRGRNSGRGRGWGGCAELDAGSGRPRSGAVHPVRRPRPP
ncbi:bifunctional DNA primase/polymerase [Streptomyces microflavus]|uniref:bifunctional DNA primase/polymerase n=1 Tax=Streptomyces microflavus TaxID=1919 RepID=UPI00386F06CC